MELRAWRTIMVNRQYRVAIDELLRIYQTSGTRIVNGGLRRGIS